MKAGIIDLKVVENTAINDTEVDLDSEKIEDTLTLLNKYIQDPIYIDNVMSHSVDAISKLKLEKNPSIMAAKEISNLIDGK